MKMYRPHRPAGASRWKICRRPPGALDASPPLQAAAVIARPTAEPERRDAVLARPTAEPERHDAVLARPTAEPERGDAVIARPPAAPEQGDAVIARPPAPAPDAGGPRSFEGLTGLGIAAALCCALAAQTSPQRRAPTVGYADLASPQLSSPLGYAPAPLGEPVKRRELNLSSVEVGPSVVSLDVEVGPGVVSLDGPSATQDPGPPRRLQTHPFFQLGISEKQQRRMDLLDSVFPSCIGVTRFVFLWGLCLALTACARHHSPSSISSKSGSPLRESFSTRDAQPVGAESACAGSAAFAGNIN